MSLWGLQTKRCSSGRLRKSCNGYARTTMASKESATFYLHIPVACVFVCARARVCMQCARLDAQRFYSAVSAFSNLTGWHLDRLHKEDYIRRSASLPRVLMPSGEGIRDKWQLFCRYPIAGDLLYYSVQDLKASILEPQSLPCAAKGNAGSAQVGATFIAHACASAAARQAWNHAVRAGIILQLVPRWAPVHVG